MRVLRHRDFSLAKAGLLACLIVVALGLHAVRPAPSESAPLDMATTVTQIG